ncbi:MAG TPA: MSHA biogenesis protein MshE, partial [Gammaproteobacteria bacterium]|nr:MSHA biogenesis protein MshE [Gammaproteobacteria bacterium]
IHIEPGHNTLRIRQRVDGVLQEQVIEEFRIAPALQSRLKLMAGLNISEKRLPQDGRFHIRVQNKHIDVRLSTLPMIHGESVVMRLLDHSQGILSFDRLDLGQNMLSSLRHLIKKSHGLILVTGPTGSGKTTTLYTALNEINYAETKIITVEDPVEYQLPRINQVQVHEKIGLTFPNVLRTSLRQDPDVILIGEMRDKETVDIGLRAAMTGHLVLSTLHTNDSISTVARLFDMDAEGFLIASSLQAIIAQRLVRHLCDECKKPYTPSPIDESFIKKFYDHIPDNAHFFEPTGCSQCNNTGYQGRIGVYELLMITTELTEALQQKDINSFTQKARQQLTKSTLCHNALLRVMQGKTTFQEVTRIAGEMVSPQDNRSS